MILKKIPFLALLLLLFGENTMSEESSTILPLSIADTYLQGVGLVPVDPADLQGENVTPIDDGTYTEFGPSSVHNFHTGNIMVSVFEAGPGKVRIDGAVYDEFVYVLEGRLILTPDGGEPMEFKKGQSVIVPKGYKGIWDMPERYRELIVVDTNFLAEK